MGEGWGGASNYQYCCPRLQPLFYTGGEQLRDVNKVVIKHLMKRLTITFLVAIAAVSIASAQTGKEWDNPEITSMNPEVAHTTAIPMVTEADVAQNDLSASPYYQSLNGRYHSTHPL